MESEDKERLDLLRENSTLRYEVQRLKAELNNAYAVANDVATELELEADATRDTYRELRVRTRVRKLRGIARSSKNVISTQLDDADAGD